ncbi:MAG: hypothetical protein M0Z52_10180 [Actinomycetota bacterium]|nr:hypothetical protein [Actinomycetota bacterium]
MSRLYTYIVKHDTGIAPNPFWGWCTLAVCTPNHQGSRVEPGDWIAGFLDKKRDYKFLYAMIVSECIHMDAYFKDKRFLNKRPRVRGTLIQRHGDNFYSFDSQGQWQQHKTDFHKDPDLQIKDTKHPWVFVSKKFWYLGKKAHPLPEHLLSLAGGRGTRVNHDEDLVEQFKKWVSHKFREGRSALPNDIKACGHNSKTILHSCCRQKIEKIGTATVFP